MIRLLLILIIVLGVLVAALIGFYLIWYAIMTRPRRKKEEGFEFIYVNNDGNSARELTNDEKDYLNTDFHPCDGDRPYIKLRYESRDGGGSLGGFLRRRQLPAHIPIKKREL